jgi:hypothetical protein
LIAVAVFAVGLAALAFTIWSNTSSRSFGPAARRGGPAHAAPDQAAAPDTFTQAAPSAPGPGGTTDAAAPPPHAPEPANFRTIADADNLGDALDRFQTAVADKVRELKPAKPLPAAAAVAPAARAALAAWLADTSERSMAAAISPDALDPDRVGVNADSPFPGGGMGPMGGLGRGPRRAFTSSPGATAPPDGAEPEKKEMMIAVAPAPGQLGATPAPGARTVHATVPARPKGAKNGAEVKLSIMLTFDDKTQQWSAGPVAVAGDPEALKAAMQKVRGAR